MLVDAQSRRRDFHINLSEKHCGETTALAAIPIPDH
jgi:hypothetical protein